MGKRRGRLSSKETRFLAQKLVKAACLAGSRQAAACEAIGITTRTFQRWKIKMVDGRTLIKKAPHNKLSNQERSQLLEVVNSRKYASLPPSKIVPLLADEGQYLASEATIYRVLREENQLAHRQISRPARGYKPKALTAKKPNQIYSWDITYLRSCIKGCFFYLYLIMDVFSRKVVGFQIYDKESSNYASDVIEDACINEGIGSDEVILHSDNGGPMKGATMLATLQRLGVTPSFSRPAVSNDNPYSESLFKTLKYCPHFPLKPFEGLLEARLWAADFVNWYNNEHLHSSIKFVTPSQRHKGQDHDILKKRHNLYLKAKKKSPKRWSGKTRNWDIINEVHLNPERGKTETIKSEKVA